MRLVRVRVTNRVAAAVCSSGALRIRVVAVVVIVALVVFVFAVAVVFAVDVAVFLVVVGCKRSWRRN